MAEAQKPSKSEMDQLREILRDNDEKLFVKRIIRPKDYPTLDLGDGNYATHQMQWGDVDTPQGKRYVVYPSVQLQGNKLIDLGEKAWDHAMKAGDYIEFDNPAKASWFSKSYKKVWDQTDPIVDNPGPGSQVYGYKVREPFDSERAFFKKDPTVAGYASEDGRIVLNPYSDPDMVDMRGVAMNEASRLYLRESKTPLNFKLTPRQMQSFKGTPYEGNTQAQMETLIGRIISKDPSVRDVTPEQRQWADVIHMELLKRDKSGGEAMKTQAAKDIQQGQAYLENAALLPPRARQGLAQKVINDVVAERRMPLPGHKGWTLFGNGAHFQNRQREMLIKEFEKAGLIRPRAARGERPDYDQHNKSRNQEIKEFETIIERFLNPSKD